MYWENHRLPTVVGKPLTGRAEVSWRNVKALHWREGGVARGSHTILRAERESSVIAHKIKGFNNHQSVDVPCSVHVDLWCFAEAFQSGRGCHDYAGSCVVVLPVVGQIYGPRGCVLRSFEIHTSGSSCHTPTEDVGVVGLHGCLSWGSSTSARTCIALT